MAKPTRRVIMEGRNLKRRPSMRIQCTCGTLQADLAHFPEASPGRLKCYCDDCQKYLHHLGRADLLDAAGGTEVIPNYPANVKIVSGVDQLKCTRLTDKGMYRWSTKCCNSPIANGRPGTPWLGIHRIMFMKDPQYLERTLGPIKSSILGKFATGPVPPGTPKGFDFKGFRLVMPFILKGKLTGKSNPSPFFAADGKTSIVQPKVLR